MENRIKITGLAAQHNVNVRASMREQAVSSGHFMRPKHQVMRDRTKYSRKGRSRNELN